MGGPRQEPTTVLVRNESGPRGKVRASKRLTRESRTLRSLGRSGLSLVTGIGLRPDTLAAASTKAQEFLGNAGTYRRGTGRCRDLRR